MSLSFAACRVGAVSRAVISIKIAVFFVFIILSPDMLERGPGISAGLLGGFVLLFRCQGLAVRRNRRILFCKRRHQSFQMRQGALGVNI